LKEFSLALLNGVIGGLIATTIALFFREVWIKIITPWYENRVYRDAHIEGTWKAKFSNDTYTDEERVEIYRVGHAVTGTITVTNGKNEGRTYNFIGSFRNLVLIATYHSKNESLLDRGTFCLLLTKNGNQLEGKCSYYSDSTKSIDHSDYVWEKIISG